MFAMTSIRIVLFAIQIANGLQTLFRCAISYIPRISSIGV